MSPGTSRRGIESILELNSLPAGVRESLYARLVPDELFARFDLDRRTLLAPDGERRLRITASSDTPWARVELRAREDDGDPVLLIDIGMAASEVPELSLVQINDPGARRFGIDRTDDGQDTLLGTLARNLREEAAAMAAGLAPGQVRAGLRMLGRVLECMDAFCALLGREFYLVEPLFYHSALLYERHGCDYFIGRDRMDGIHGGFQPGGEIRARLDGSTPFRPPGAERSIRGRSWAVHDGILGDPFSRPPSGVKMYRVPGRPARISTFPDGTY